MKSQEIKVGHIYYVNFEPVAKNEFGKKHLAVVIKKNHDKITFVVIPMTSSDSGLGINKISLGKLDCLPENLREAESYAVIDQSRTVHSSRFMPLKWDNTIYDAVMPKEKMHEIYRALIKDLLHDVPSDELLQILL